MNNNVRVLDIVQGPTFYHYIESLPMEHEPYFHEIFPEILKKILKAFEAIRFLHANGYRHGDIRNDHIIMERDSGNYVWIDFDYDYETSENPFSLDLYGLGNILLFSAGKGFSRQIYDSKRHLHLWKPQRTDGNERFFHFASVAVPESEKTLPIHPHAA